MPIDWHAATVPSANELSLKRSPRPWIYVFVAPIVLVMTVALVKEPARMGEPSDVTDIPLSGLIAMLLVMTALMAGVWAFSRFRFRTTVVFFQVAVVWVSGMLYGLGFRTHVSVWDVVEEVVLIVTTLVQLVPGNGSTTQADKAKADPLSPTGPSSDPIRDMWQRLRRPVGLILLVAIIIRNREGLASGSPLPTVASLALIAFFGWLFLRTGPSFDLGSTTADELRATNRRELTWWSWWTVLAAVIVAWASVVHGFQPSSLTAVAIPLLPVLMSLIGYRKADAIAAKAQENQNRWPAPPQR